MLEIGGIVSTRVFLTVLATTPQNDYREGYSMCNRVIPGLEDAIGDW